MAPGAQLQDVAVSMPQDLSVMVGFGDNLGGFDSQAYVTVSGSGSAFNIAIGDSNRDQYDDLVVADPITSRLVVFPGGPVAGWESPHCLVDRETTRCGSDAGSSRGA